MKIAILIGMSSSALIFSMIGLAFIFNLYVQLLRNKREIEFLYKQRQPKIFDDSF